MSDSSILNIRFLQSLEGVVNTIDNRNTLFLSNNTDSKPTSWIYLNNGGSGLDLPWFLFSCKEQGENICLHINVNEESFLKVIDDKLKTDLSTGGVARECVDPLNKSAITYDEIAWRGGDYYDTWFRLCISDWQKLLNYGKDGTELNNYEGLRLLYEVTKAGDQWSIKQVINPRTDIAESTFEVSENVSPISEDPDFYTWMNDLIIPKNKFQWFNEHKNPEVSDITLATDINYCPPKEEIINPDSLSKIESDKPENYNELNYEDINVLIYEDICSRAYRLKGDGANDELYSIDWPDNLSEAVYPTYTYSDEPETLYGKTAPWEHKDIDNNGSGSMGDVDIIESGHTGGGGVSRSGNQMTTDNPNNPTVNNDTYPIANKFIVGYIISLKDLIGIIDGYYQAKNIYGNEPYSRPTNSNSANNWYYFKPFPLADDTEGYYSWSWDSSTEGFNTVEYPPLKSYFHKAWKWNNLKVHLNSIYKEFFNAFISDFHISNITWWNQTENNWNDLDSRYYIDEGITVDRSGKITGAYDPEKYLSNQLVRRFDIKELYRPVGIYFQKLIIDHEFYIINLYYPGKANLKNYRIPATKSDGTHDEGNICDISIGIQKSYKNGSYYNIGLKCNIPSVPFIFKGDSTQNVSGTWGGIELMNALAVPGFLNLPSGIFISSNADKSTYTVGSVSKRYVGVTYTKKRTDIGVTNIDNIDSQMGWGQWTLLKGSGDPVVFGIPLEQNDIHFTAHLKWTMSHTLTSIGSLGIEKPADSTQLVKVKQAGGRDSYINIAKGSQKSVCTVLNTVTNITNESDYNGSILRLKLTSVLNMSEFYDDIGN